MAHVAKHTKAAAGHLCAHYDRTSEKIGNQNIDPGKTKENYNLAPERDVSQVEFIQQRTSEVNCLNRKDVNVMCSWIVTAPKDLPDEDNRKFFKESYNFLIARYGDTEENNVISCYVHMDEITPHMHFAFVPVVPHRRKGEYKVSAKEAINRQDLQTFHQDLDKHLTQVFGRELGVLNEATKDGNKSIAELKRGQSVKDIKKARNEIKTLEDNIKHLQDEKDSLQAKIRGVEGQVMTMGVLELIKPKRTITGATKGVTVEQVQDFKKTVVEYNKLKSNYKELQKKYDELNQEHERVKRQVPTMKQRFSQIAVEGKLKEAQNFISRIPNDVVSAIELKIKQEEKLEQMLQRENHSWEMEL